MRVGTLLLVLLLATTATTTTAASAASAGTPNVAQCVAEREFTSLPVAEGVILRGSLVDTFDIDGDGALDVVAVDTSYGDHKLAWFRNLDGAGTFGPAHVVKSGTNIGTQAVRGADLDGDGDLDLVGVFSSSSYSPRVLWFENTDGAGAFSQWTLEAGKFSPRDLTVADMDGNGALDVVVIYGDRDLALFRNAGAGAFGSLEIVGVSTVGDVYDIVAFDVDNDGDVDVVGSGSQDSKMLLWANLGNGTSFAAAALISVDVHSPGTLRVADVDQDGFSDLIVLTGISGKGMAWLRNPGTLAPTPGGVWAASSVVDYDVQTIRGIDTGDFNGDGLADVVATVDDPDGTDTLLVFAGQGRAGFGAGQVLSSAVANPFPVTAGDINGNGIPDVVTVSRATSAVVWFNVTAVPAAFSGLDTLGTAMREVRDLAAEDLDGDGDLDVVYVAAVGDGPGDRVGWFRNTDGDGSFGPEILLSSTLSVPSGLAVADLDRDGDLDIAVAANSNIVLFVNDDGAGGFGSPLELDMASSVWGSEALLAADFNGDGWLDLAVSTGSGHLAWFPSVSGGTSFGSYTSILDNLERPTSLAAADLDGDGTVDLALTDITADTVMWLANSNGTGSFGPVHVMASSMDGAASIVLADLDGDGDMDAVALATYDGIVGWFNNTDGGGSFSGPLVLDGRATGAASLDVGDVDGDGVLDILYTGDAGVILLVGDGDANADGSGAYGTRSAPLTVTTSVFVRVTAADWDADGDLDVVVGASSSLVGTFRTLTRTVRHVASPQTRTLALDSPHCQGRANTSFACVAASLHRTSRCVTDTLALPSGAPGGRAFSCARDRHASIHWAVNVAPEAGDGVAVRFDCGGDGVLFRATSSGGLTGAVTLSRVAVVGSGAAMGTALEGPAFVAGSGAELVLVNSTVGGGVSAASSLLVMGGTGGCVAAVGGGTVALEATMLSGCSASRSGGAGAAIGPGSLLVVGPGSTLSGNTAGAHGGGAVALDGAQVSVAHATVSGNSAALGGGGLALVSDGSATVTGSTLASNTAALGGGLWVGASSSATVSHSELSLNGAAFGAAFAALPDDGPFTVAASVFDVPASSRHDLAHGIVPASGSPDDPLARPCSLHVSDVLVRDNTASRYGGGFAVCEALVNVSGAHVAVAGNTVVGTAAAVHSSADVFVCALAPSAGFTPDRSTASGIPWLVFDASAWASASAWHIHGPTARLEWALRPPLRVQPGDRVAGSVRARDWFGQTVVYSSSAVGSAFDPAAGLVLPELPDVVLASTAAPLPDASLGVSDTSRVPLNVTLVVAPLAESTGGLAVAPLRQLITVVACAAGSGGVVRDGATTCAACSVGTESLEESFEACVAQDPCPDNAVRLVANSTSEPCVCQRGFWAPSGLVSQPCVPCPAGGVCDGGLARPVAAPGYFPESAGSTLFLECPNADACMGDGQCRPGYRDRLCAQCAEGYYSLRGSCSRCNNSANTAVAVLLALAGLTALTTLLAFSLAESVRYKFAAAMIGLNALQISAIYGKLDLDWGGFAAVYFDVVSSVNLNLELTSPECSVASGTDTWVLKLVLTLLLPLFAGAGLAALAPMFAVRYTVGQIGPAVGRAWFQALVLLYLPLTRAAFSVFGCRRDASGRWVLDDDPARSCYTPAWWAGLFPIGLAATLVYALALPGCVVWVLSSKRRVLDPVTFTLRFGFLVGRFTQSAWWYEAAIMGRKLLVVLCMTFFFSTDGKASATVFALIGALVHLGMLRPYASVFHNGLAVTVLAATMSVLYAGTFRDSDFRRLGVAAGLIVNVAAILVGNVLDLVWMARREAKTEEDEFFQPEVVAMDSELAAPASAMDSFGSSVELGLVSSGAPFSGVVLAQTAEVSSYGIDSVALS